MDDVEFRAVHVHTFPVDISFGEDALEAWKEICNFGRRVTFTGGERWGVVECDGEVCWRIEDSRVTVREI